MIPILVKLHEWLVGRMVVGAERLGDRFEGPDKEAACVLLDVYAVVGIS